MKRANKTVCESISDEVITDFGDAEGRSQRSSNGTTSEEDIPLFST